MQDETPPTILNQMSRWVFIDANQEIHRSYTFIDGLLMNKIDSRKTRLSFNILHLHLLGLTMSFKFNYLTVERSFSRGPLILDDNLLE